MQWYYISGHLYKPFILDLQHMYSRIDWLIMTNRILVTEY